MKPTKSLIAVSLLVLALMVDMSFKPAMSAATPESPYTITEFTVASGSASQMEPAISGNVVVWREQPGGFGGQDSDIYAIDLSTGQQFVICRANGAQIDPSISGKLVVWQDHRLDILGDIYA